MDNSVFRVLEYTRVKESQSTYSVKKKYVYVKRVIDIAISLASIIVSLPFLVIIGVLIKLDSNGPVFFNHKRIGKNGKEIYIYKFRTMVVDAASMIKDFSVEQQKEYEENYKLINDPRITKFGTFLRKTSLDELPQFLNVLKGDLSFIGPRPVVEDELEKYKDQKHKLLSVLPGITGNWAANGRSCTSYEERIMLELYYVGNISVKLDLQIFFKTIFEVIKAKGAY